MPNQTRQDAFTRVVEAKMGSCADASPEYLLSLREFAQNWVNEIDQVIYAQQGAEADRLDALEQEADDAWNSLD